MSGPGAPRPMASEADRERLVALLREHYAVGQFGLDELDRRVGVVLSARYLDEMAAAVADLPGTAGPGTATPGAGAPRRARRRRGHAHADQPAAGWVPTNERFRDPSTSTIMRVWVDPADQSRHYVPEPEP
jgi:Domain of unknown function (DUF1707)